VPATTMAPGVMTAGLVPRPERSRRSRSRPRPAWLRSSETVSGPPRTRTMASAGAGSARSCRRSSSRPGSSATRSRSVTRTKKKVGERCRYGLHAGQDVPVEGHRKGGMPEVFTHDLDRDTGVHRGRGDAHVRRMKGRLKSRLGGEVLLLADVGFRPTRSLARPAAAWRSLRSLVRVGSCSGKWITVLCRGGLGGGRRLGRRAG
jgi:hypothetical protein